MGQTRESYHLIGVGGIGMSALARILLQQGMRVRGSDQQESTLLEELQREGAEILIGHTEEGPQEGATVVFSSGIQSENVELARAKELKMPLLHRSDLLDQLMKGKKGLLVTGTHGKTTTTALLSAVLLEAGADPSFVVGGILQSLKTNGKAGQGDYFVAEADESDGSFLKTLPFGAIVTNLGNDHLNYWGTEEKLDRAFGQFFQNAQHPEHLFWCADDLRLRALKPKGVSYGFTDEADWRVESFQQTEWGVAFDLVGKKIAYRAIELSLLGRHNALNGAAVFGLALSLGIAEEAIRRAFRAFSGVSRRMEKRGEVHKVTLFDDYGHHPTEIATTIKALREAIRERRLVVVFQPHRYTRVHDLMADFANCFGEADEVILTDIYSSGETPIPGVTIEVLEKVLRKKLGAKLHYIPRNELEAGVAGRLRPLDVVLTMGAGDVTQAGPPILKLYEERAPKLTVGVLFGGTSAEHPVSVMSARNIIQNLDLSTYNVKLFGITTEGLWITGPDALSMKGGARFSGAVLEELLSCDVCLPILHGPQGEDGMAQGLLDTLHIPYAGCDYRSGSISMQKAWTKQVARLHNIPTAAYFEMDAITYRKNPSLLLQRITDNLRYPVWIKPVHLGSSIGVSCARTPDEVAECAERAFYFDETIIVENEVDGRQIEFSLLGNEYVRIALPGEIINHGGFVAFDKKYGETAMEIRVPAELTKMQKEIGYDLAIRMYRAAACRGLARIDFFLDQEGHYWFNEINPMPGFTDTSAYPKMWMVTGLKMGEICDEMIALALHRSRGLVQIRGKQR